MRRESSGENSGGQSEPVLRGVILVASGGTAGTLLRHGLDAVVPDAAGLPLGTFVVNVTGAFLLGLLAQSLAHTDCNRARRTDLRLLLGTGALGGYTTYSLLALDTAGLMLEQRFFEAAAYGLGTVVVGAVASWIGMLAVRARRRDT